MSRDDEEPRSGPSHPTDPVVDGDFATRRIEHLGPFARPERWGTTVQTRDDKDHALVRRFSLLVTGGPDAGQRCVSAGDRLVIGTHDSADLVLSDPTVSRLHCEVAVAGKVVMVRDLESSNGTLVDGVSVEQAHLRSGQVLSLGRSQVRFEIGGEPVKVPLAGKDGFGLLVGGSAPMRRLYARLERAAGSDATVLLEGEPGTGKRLAAESIHRESERRQGPFIALDIRQIPARRLRELLLGPEGVFVGAQKGTLFLTGLVELPGELQPELLRILESREIEPPGAEPLAIDVRVIAATDRSLEAEVNGRRFRSDLYYRLAVIQIPLPPLRDRPEDLPTLIEHFLHDLRVAERPEIEALRRPELLVELGRRPWPGNVRELGALISRWVAIRAPSENTGSGTDAFERGYLEALLAAFPRDPNAAACAAGIGRLELERLLARYGLLV